MPTCVAKFNHTFFYEIGRSTDLEYVYPNRLVVSTPNPPAVFCQDRGNEEWLYTMRTRVGPHAIKRWWPTAALIPSNNGCDARAAGFLPCQMLVADGLLIHWLQVGALPAEHVPDWRT